MNATIAVKAFIVKNNKLLILKRSTKDEYKQGIWELPGGGLEINEDPKSGLIREVKEEADLDVKIIQPLNVQHFTKSDGTIITMIIFLCETVTNKVKLSHEHTDYEWIDIKKSKEKLASFFHEEVDIYWSSTKITTFSLI